MSDKSVIGKFIDKAAKILRPGPANTNVVLGRKFSEALGEPLLSSDEIKILKDADQKWREHWRDRNERFIESAAKQVYLDKLGQSEKSNAAQEGDLAGFRNICDEYEAKRERARVQMHQISAETLTLVRRAIENFVLASDVWLAHRSELEQSEASEFGIPFTPSPLYRTAQRTAEVYKRILPKLEPDGSNPLSRLQFLQLD